MRQGVAADEQGNRAARGAVQKIVDDQSGLLRIVNIQTCLLTAHFDLHFDPFIGNQIHIGFVLCRELLAQSVQGNSGMEMYCAEWLRWS